MEITVPVRDHYGNEWRLTPSGRLEVMAPGAVGVVVWEQLGSPAQSVATDDHGFVWLVAGGEVLPHGNRFCCGKTPCLPLIIFNFIIIIIIIINIIKPFY